MARLIKFSWAERPSSSVLGSGRSLKSYFRRQLPLADKERTTSILHTLSSDLVYLLRPL